VCPGVGGAHQPARARIFSLAMMGGGAFILLKGGQAGLESTKRAKVRLAILPKILHIAPSEDGHRLGNIGKGTWKDCI
jgi:hypothetical protein